MQQRLAALGAAQKSAVREGWIAGLRPHSNSRGNARYFTDS